MSKENSPVIRQTAIAQAKSAGGPIAKKKLVTVVVAHICAPNEDIFDPQRIIEEISENQDGRIIHYEKGTLIAAFEAPSEAIEFGFGLQDALKQYEFEIALGIHMRECQINVSITSQTVDLVKSMLKKVDPNRLLLTQTVKDLISGKDLSFTPYKRIFDPISNEPLLLFNIERDLGPIKKNLLYDKGHDTDLFLESVMKVIESNLDSESFRIGKLCREIGISERQLQRKLKLITNKTPAQFIASVRLHHARELLLSQKGNISEIAFKTGYSNPSYFAKCFKKEFGANPSDFATNPVGG